MFYSSGYQHMGHNPKLGFLKFFWVACFSNFSACFSFSFAKNLQKIKFNFYSSLLIYEYTANQTEHKKVNDVNKS